MKSIKELVTVGKDFPAYLKPEEIKHICQEYFDMFQTDWCEEHILVGEEGHFAKCEKCGYVGGWYCANSPDHQCYYYTEPTDDPTKRRVLHTNFIIDVPKDYNDEGESMDNCLFCHEPEERK